MAHARRQRVAPAAREQRRAPQVAARAAGKIIKITAQPNKAVTTSTLLQTLSDLGPDEGASEGADGNVSQRGEGLRAQRRQGQNRRPRVVTLRHRKARLGRNPQTGAPIQIKASKKIAFRQTALMKEMVTSGQQITLTTHGSTGGQKPTD